MTTTTLLKLVYRHQGLLLAQEVLESLSINPMD
jgi:hypothetical protein